VNKCCPVSDARDVLSAQTYGLGRSMYLTKVGEE
jgi:hypothetical protein